MISTTQIITQTKKWITEVVIGCNFCPFAAHAMRKNRVHYQVEISDDVNICLAAFQRELMRLDKEPSVETSFLIFPGAFNNFDNYLDALAVAEKLLLEKGYEGVYQLASFHPLYLFAGSDEMDAANYTNRSVYPMFHLLREESIDRALENYQSPEKIPARNINFAREKGKAYMKLLRDTCLYS
jgi:uncharacterized protein